MSSIFNFENMIKSTVQMFLSISPCFFQGLKKIFMCHNQLLFVYGAKVRLKIYFFKQNTIKNILLI